MYRIVSPNSFLRIAKKFFRKNPSLKERFKDIIRLLQNNPSDPALKLHPLTGNLQGLHAVRLTYKYGITIIFRITEKEIILVDVGSHDDVYR